MSKVIDWLKENWVNILIMLGAWMLPVVAITDVILDYGHPRPGYFVDMTLIKVGIIVMLPWGYGMQCVLRKLFGLVGVE